VAYASDVDFAATTTRVHCQKLWGSSSREHIPVYPFFARSMATCLPMPREAPTTKATLLFFEAIVVDAFQEYPSNAVRCISRSRETAILRFISDQERALWTSAQILIP
jgi:hypothetical protein